MRRMTLLLAAVSILSLAVVLGGCGGSSGGSAAAGSGVSVAGKAKPPPPPPPPTPTSDRIAFDRLSSTKTEVFVMNTNGTGAVEITATTEGSNFDPCWSPSGLICCSSDRGGTTALWTMQANGTGATQLTTPRDRYDAHQWADWSPMGDKVVFSAYPDTGLGLQRIYVVDVASKEVAELTFDDDRFDDFSPSLSPDGTTIVFSSTQLDASQYELYMVPVSGGTPTRLNIAGSTPDWSPAGGKIAYTAGGQIWSLSVGSDGSPVGSPVQITTTAGIYKRVSWSPDGSEIAYEYWVSSKKGYTQRLAKIDIATKTVTELGDGRNPEWSPVLQ